MSSLSDEAKYANKADFNGNLRGSSCIYLGVNNDTTLFKNFIPPFQHSIPLFIQSPYNNGYRGCISFHGNL